MAANSRLANRRRSPAVLHRPTNGCCRRYSVTRGSATAVRQRRVQRGDESRTEHERRAHADQPRARCCAPSPGSVRGPPADRKPAARLGPRRLWRSSRSVVRRLWRSGGSDAAERGRGRPGDLVIEHTGSGRHQIGRGVAMPRLQAGHQLPPHAGPHQHADQHNSTPPLTCTARTCRRSQARPDGPRRADPITTNGNASRRSRPA